MTTDSRLLSDQEGNRLADAARNVADQAGQTVEAQASTTMDQIATTIEEVAHAIRRAGEELRQDQPQIASVADTAAGQVERAATYLESHEPREMLETIQESARRQPALVIGAGIAFGLVLGRLLRTTLPTDEPHARNYRTGGTPRYGERYPMTSGGNGGSRSTDIGDPSASIVASTRVVKAGGSVDTGTSRGSNG
jgi:hypothetical protein